MSGTFDDWTYGEEASPESEAAATEPVRTLEAVLAEAVPDTMKSLLKPAPPSYEAVKEAKEAQGAAVTPEELAVVAQHKQARRDREAEEAAIRERRQAESALLAEAAPGDIHKWALVALHLAEQATDPREKTMNYEDAERYIGIARRATVLRAREAKKESGSQ